jgi:hypothetical protein
MFLCMHTRYFDQINPLEHSFLSPFLPFKSNFNGFHYFIFTHVYEVLCSCSPSLYSLLLPSLLLLVPTPKQSLLYIPVINFLRSRFHI